MRPGTTWWLGCVIMSARLHSHLGDRQLRQDAPAAIILYLFASLLGASATIAFLASSSWLLALLCAPFGGSALALMIAVAVYALRTEREPLI